MKIFRYRLLNHILFWIFIFFFYTFPMLASYGFVIDSFVNLIYIPVDILTVYFVIEFLIPRFIFKSQKRNLILFTLGTAAAICLNIFISHLIMFNIQPALGFWTFRKPFVSE